MCGAGGNFVGQTEVELVLSSCCCDSPLHQNRTTILPMKDAQTTFASAIALTRRFKPRHTLPLSNDSQRITYSITYSYSSTTIEQHTTYLIPSSLVRLPFTARKYGQMAMAGDVMRSSSGVGSMSFTQAATRPASTASNKQAHRPHETNFERSSGMAGFREFKPHETNAASSQDSTYSISSSSGAVSVPSLLNSSNNVSQTTLDTDATSPISPKSNKDYVQKQYNWSQERSSGSLAVKRSNDRLRTPERQVNAPRHDLGLTSPMSIGTPASGMKRMASGAVKSMGNGIMDSPASVRTHRRADSESSTGSKASEVSYTLACVVYCCSFLSAAYKDYQPPHMVT